MIVGAIYFSLGGSVGLKGLRETELGHDLLRYTAECLEVNLGPVNRIDNNSFAGVRCVYERPRGRRH